MSINKRSRSLVRTIALTMSSNKNSNNSTNIKCTNFIGNTCLDWLLFKKEWLLYAQNLGVEEIITRGTYGGVDFKELRSPFTTKTELLSQFINKQVMLRRPEFLTNYTTLLTVDYPWLPYALSRVTIPIDQALVRGSTIYHYLPTAEETDPVAVELPFPCSFYRSLPIVPSGSTYPILPGNMTSLRLNSIQVNAIVNSITNMKLQSMCRSKSQLDTFMSGDPQIPGSSRTFAQCLTENLDTDGQIQAFLENLKVEKVANMTAASSYGDKVKACGVHFSKLPQHRRDEVSEFISVDDYHGAYQHLNLHFLQLGAGNIFPFEEECKRYRLQIGQGVREHLDLQVQAFKRLAQTLYLEQKLAESIVPLSEVEIPDRIAIQNSGDLTDAQIIATGGSVLIPELRRFNWILESIAHSPRFKSIADHFKSADLTDKRLRDLIRMINNSDLSPTGQAELRSEWASNPNYKSEIAAYIVQVKKDSGFPVADINANVNSAKTGKKREREESSSSATSSSDPQVKKCTYHPLSKTHWTSECKLNPNPKTADSKRDKAGTYGKGSGCTYCAKNEKLKKNASNHSTKRCKLNPANKSNAEANSSMDVEDGETSSSSNISKKAKCEIYDEFTKQFPDWKPSST